MEAIRLVKDDEGGMTVPILVPIVHGTTDLSGELSGVRIEEGVEHEPFFHVVMGENQPEYTPLPCLRSRRGEVITRWTFTAEERAQIAAGHDLFLSCMTMGAPLQPLLPLVANDAGSVCMAVVAARGD